jgi:hypothetical protein
MQKYFCLLILVFSISAYSHAQHLGSAKGNASLGIGLGLPYGGLGTKLTFNPADQFALFAGLGYNFDGLAVNAGAQYLFPGKKQTEFFLTAMYGYNAVILVEGASGLNDTFSGFTGGLGVRINSLGNRGAYWDIGLLVPARSQAYKDARDFLQNSGGITNLRDPWPVQFFLGYNFLITGKAKQKGLGFRP